MKWFIILITVLFLVGFAICDIHMVVYYFYPQTAKIKIDKWLDPTYHYDLSISWYIYELCNKLAWVLWFYGIAKISALVSYKLFRIMIVFTLYFITQFGFWVWNRNTVFFSNIIVYIYMAIAILFLFFPDKKGGKLIDIEDY